jgi:hypothetical protein
MADNLSTRCSLPGDHWDLPEAANTVSQSSNDESKPQNHEDFSPVILLIPNELLYFLKSSLVLFLSGSTPPSTGR